MKDKQQPAGRWENFWHRTRDVAWVTAAATALFIPAFAAGMFVAGEGANIVKNSAEKARKEDNKIKDKKD